MKYVAWDPEKMEIRMHSNVVMLNILPDAYHSDPQASRTVRPETACMKDVVVYSNGRCRSVAITSMAVMFGWVALWGDAANFHRGMSAGGGAVLSSNSVPFARILFAFVSILTGLASFWAWKKTFRSLRAIRAT